MLAFCWCYCVVFCFFFFQAEDGIRDDLVTGVQTCALPISVRSGRRTRRTETRPDRAFRGVKATVVSVIIARSVTLSSSTNRRVASESMPDPPRSTNVTTISGRALLTALLGSGERRVTTGGRVSRV